MTDGDRVGEGSRDASGKDGPAEASEDGEEIRVWLVERTFSDDELNIVILVYATTDGHRYYRKERALTSFTGPDRVTLASLSVPVDSTGTVEDPDRAEWYATEARRMASKHDPDDPI